MSRASRAHENEPRSFCVIRAEQKTTACANVITLTPIARPTQPEEKNRIRFAPNICTAAFVDRRQAAT